MPILGATGAVADHICANCGAETHITMNEWVKPEADDVICTPPCACGSVESFSWHDWVYVGTDGKPDHAHPGAKQMVLIERVAQVLGRSKRAIPEKPAGRTYAEPPTAPTQASVRAYAARLRGAE